MHTTRKLVLHARQSYQSVSSPSHMVYQFTCSCGDVYIGKTNRRLAQRVAEHLPKWVQQMIAQQNGTRHRTNRSPSSSIAEHVLTTGHHVNPPDAFKVLLRNRRPIMLAISETLLIS
ncbi:unnamed protein product, partial [Dicrocoelium dendriticum]